MGLNTSTTFKELRDSGACQARYRFLAKALGGVKKYGDTTPIPLLTILDTNGLCDAEWAMERCRSLYPLYDEYLAKYTPIWDEYRAKIKPIWDECQAKCEALLREVLEAHK